MPRKKRISDEELVEVIRIYEKDVFPNDNDCVGPSNSVWEEISKNIQNRKSAKLIYTEIKANRRNLLGKLGRAASVSDHNVDTSSDGTNGSSDSTELNFNITLSADEWKKIVTEIDYRSTERGDAVRTYSALKPFVWTNIIHEHVWEQTKVACPISYKRAKVRDVRYFVNINTSPIHKLRNESWSGR